METIYHKIVAVKSIGEVETRDVSHLTGWMKNYKWQRKVVLIAENGLELNCVETFKRLKDAKAFTTYNINGLSMSENGWQSRRISTVDFFNALAK